MHTDDRPDTVLIREEGAAGRAPRGGGRPPSGTLPPDLLAEGVTRLRVIALLYAFVYFMAGFVPPLMSSQRATFFAEVIHWLPGAVSITTALTVAGLTLHAGLSPVAKMRIGLLFEILGSVGIAAAEYHGISAPIAYGEMGDGGFGLSWVSAWVLLFTVAVPTPPRRALLAALLSVTAVPLTFQLGVALGINTVDLRPDVFFFALVFPYLLIVIMAYVGARVVYRLGAAVREAREMGSYRLVQRLGRGGMGEVWRAEHRMLARPAAIKLVRPEILGGTDSESRRVLLRRFEREAQTTALLRSPHTMELYDYGVADDGTFYYVMELLDGFDLDNMVERFGPLPAARAAQLLAQVCDSLAEAHEAGLIHRDVKPANIYVCRYGRRVDFVKVLDFGLVKRGATPEAGEEKLTAADITGGTPAYMSPEQALGMDEVDGRSDLYAVGCVGYWLLTGSMVFRGRTPMATLAMHINQKPVAPSHATELPIPAELDALVLACLAKDPSERPQTADELRDRLLAVPGLGEWTPERARHWWDAHQPAPTPGTGFGLAESEHS